VAATVVTLAEALAAYGDRRADDESASVMARLSWEAAAIRIRTAAGLLE
jgi:hypothetical protein